MAAKAAAEEATVEPCSLCLKPLHGAIACYLAPEAVELPNGTTLWLWPSASTAPTTWVKEQIWLTS